MTHARLIDYLCNRSNSVYVDSILQLADENQIQCIMSAGSFYTITYLIELDLKRNGYTDKSARILRLREILNGVLDTFYIPDLDWAILHDGVNNTKFKDLEDSYQYEAAYKSACDYMITDNLKDFKKSDKAFLTVVSPREFLALFA